MQYLSSRLRLVQDAIRVCPRAFADPYFYSLFLPGMARSAISHFLFPAGNDRVHDPLYKILMQECFDGENFVFWLRTNGKPVRFVLSPPNSKADRTTFLLEFYDLVFPLLAREQQAQLKEFSAICEKYAVVGVMPFEYNRSIFFSKYFYPHVKQQVFQKDGPYVPESFSFEKGSVILDVGANIGLFSVSAALLVGKKGCVYAFEPVPEYARILKKNCALNPAANVVLIKKGLSDRESTAEFKGMEIIHEGRGDAVLTTLDAAIVEHKIPRIDFVKMDIEGFERRALHGGLKTLKKFLPTLALCIYHLPDDPAVIVNRIKSISPAYEITKNSTGKKFFARCPAVKCT